jgi:hypothetical protein
LLFLSADHGAAHVPGFLKEQKIPAGNVNLPITVDSINIQLKQTFGRSDLLLTIINYQAVLNDHLVDSLNLDKTAIKEWIVRYFSNQPGIFRVVPIENIFDNPLPATLREMVVNSFYPSRSGDIQLLYLPQWIEQFERGGTTHGVWNPYDAHIPLLWYGWNIRQGRSNQPVNITDIAPTVSALLRIQMPSGCTGNVINDVMK